MNTPDTGELTGHPSIVNQREELFLKGRETKLAGQPSTKVAATNAGERAAFRQTSEYAAAARIRAPQSRAAAQQNDNTRNKFQFPPESY